MIFISYAHAYKKDSVDRLYEFLTEKGYEIWKDDKGGIKGKMLDDMAGKCWFWPPCAWWVLIGYFRLFWLIESSLDGLEKSDIVIICFSEDYTKSGDCELEVEKAVSDKKKLIVVKLNPDFDLKKKFKKKAKFNLLLGKQIWVSNRL